MSDGATKTDILYLKEQLNRIESELEAVKKMVQQVLSRQDLAGSSILAFSPNRRITHPTVLHGELADVFG